MNKLARHYRRVLDVLPFGEGLAAFGAVYLAVALRFGLDPAAVRLSIGPIWPEALAFAAITLVALTGVGLYNRRLRDGIEGTLVRIVVALGFATSGLVLLYYAIPGIFLGRGVLALALLIMGAALVAIRIQVLRLSANFLGKRRVLVLGAGRRAATLEQLRRRTDLVGLRIVGYVEHRGDTVSVPPEKIVTIEGDFVDWVRAQDVDEILVAPDERRMTMNIHELLLCRRAGVLISDLPTFYERETGRLPLDTVLPVALSFDAGMRSSFLGDRLKRMFDILIAVTLLLLAAPVMLLAALAIWLESGCRGPILYRQCRVGADETEFFVLKFRSMRPDAEADGQARWATTDDPRITRVGAFIRRYRIDELPQIYNVLRGEMSFVGPRPERPEFVRQLEQRFASYADRHRAKPGLTGWAQINYPYGASDEDAFRKLQYDLFYVKHRGLLLDLTILLQTAEVVLWGRGAR